jgi:hypothetical protein
MKPSTICSFLFAAMVAAVIAIACAPQFPRAVFVYARHPDFPRTEYLAGKLGVFQPSYARSYLVIAYRYLNGVPLSAVEREQVRDYWKDRETGSWDKTAISWVDKWEEARTRVPAAPRHQERRATQGKYQFDALNSAFFLNCAEDAYRNAYQTLEARGAQFGFRSAAVRSWRDAQDAVFGNCDDKTAMPQPAGAELPAIIRADREYQIAAANFYAGHYAEAEAQFRRIAATPASPWSKIAPYLVARTMARAGSSRSALAESTARELLKNPSLTPLHGMTRVLLYRMILKDRDESYFHELGRDLASGREGRSFREELWDYTTLFDHYIDYAPWERWDKKKKNVDASVFLRDDLSDWIFTFQGSDSKAASHALARWHERRSVPWLIAALRHATPNSRTADELTLAAAELGPSSPGFEITNFYRLAFLVDSHHKEDARVELDRLLQSPLTKSSANLFRSLRMRAAPDLTDFLRFAARAPVLLTDDSNEGETPPYPSQDDPWERKLFAGAMGKLLLDRDSVKILNERTPMRLLRQAALSGDVPEYAQRDVLVAAFTRALLLDDDEDGLRLAARLREVGGDRENYLSAYEKTGESGDRRFAGIFYVLHHPESRPYLASGIGRTTLAGRIDDFRDNWWCPVDIAVELDARTNIPWRSGPPRDNPDASAWSTALLTEEDRKTATDELARLAATASGPDYLIAETMRYARAHPADSRIPEALHYALRSQRYGCVRTQTASAAKAAWKYLWWKYPKSTWTQKTNYNFEAENLPKPGR